MVHYRDIKFSYGVRRRGVLLLYTQAHALSYRLADIYNVDTPKNHKNMRWAHMVISRLVMLFDESAVLPVYTHALGYRLVDKYDIVPQNTTKSWFFW